MHDLQVQEVGFEVGEGVGEFGELRLEGVEGLGGVWCVCGGGGAE